jgi:GH35 family endo-1,4-beta-xylanase
MVLSLAILGKLDGYAEQTVETTSAKPLVAFTNQQAQRQVASPRENSDEDVQQGPKRDRRSLKEAAGNRFKVGVGVSHLVVRDPEDAALIRQHYQVLTPENCMKPQNIHPADDEWNFHAADGFVDFARANNLEVVGHCLVWAKDDRTDQWMMQENGKPVSRETLLRRIETHINTVVERYADTATMWDVVNEAIADSGDALLRDSVYSRTTGIDFIVTAFKAARAKDPDALLIYNDYNDHKPGKREKVIQLLSQLKQKGAPVDAYGMQGHFELGEDSMAQIQETLDALRKLGMKVVVSELDIDVVTRGRWWADGGKYRNELTTHDPYKHGIPTEVEQRQIEQYVELFRLFDQNSDIIERVSFWNLHDGQSWLNYFPWRRVNYPLLFDRNRRPKPAFDAVYDTLQKQRPDDAPPPTGDPGTSH